MTTIIANVSRMFETIEPWDVSNSVANLGDEAGRLTWKNALSIAKERRRWLKSPVLDACEGMREWARDTGAWSKDEIDAWSTDECLALFVQNIASELRDNLDADNLALIECVARYLTTDWNNESGYPIGDYRTNRIGNVIVEYYTGC